MDMEHELYPLKFTPILKERIWGGTRLRSLPGKQSQATNIGESWELSGMQGDISVVKNGFLKNNSLDELIEIYMGDLVGDKIYERFGLEFPILIKLIDAQDDLSIQVHPDDLLAARRHDSYGKTEMWYVMEAGKDSHLIAGFNRTMDKDAYMQAVEEKTLKNILNIEKVTAGDVFFIPAGRIHAICKDILIAEIQQTSDITYRIYDWDRVDADGNSRELHTELAVDAIDYSMQSTCKTPYRKRPQDTTNLAKCSYFTTNIISLNQAMEKEYRSLDSFVIYMAVAGNFGIDYGTKKPLTVSKGETVLLPAVLKNIQLIPAEPTELLEIYIE
jgi:mannose-6-phosphate isomerase